MTYAIVGAGGVGQCFSALLARANVPVMLLATPRSASRLRSSGAIRLTGVVDMEVGVGNGGVAVTSDASEIPDGAAVIFATKGHDLPGAIESVRSAAGERLAWAGGMQNGVVKDDLLVAAFGARRVVGAATIVGAERMPDESVYVSTPGVTYFGELDERESERARQAAETFDAVGIPTHARSDIRSVLWSKACNAAGVFGVAVLARVSNDRLFSDPNLMRAYLVLVRETAAIAAAYGVEVGDFAGFPPIRTFVDRTDEETLARLDAPVSRPGPPAYASMTRDLLVGAPLEVDAVFGDLVERADRKGVPVPGLRFARDMLRGVSPRPSERTNQN